MDGMATSMQNRAMALLRTTSHGVLSSHSDALAGYPYGSLVPYVVGARGQPIILISQLAQHTRNIKANPRVSLTVHAPLGDESDLQNIPRLCLLADAGACQDDAGQGDYLQRFPEARAYLDLDFEFYRLVPFRIHLIAGFGQVQWLEPESA